MDVISKNDFLELARRFHRGQVVVFPTESSYGLGGDATSQAVADRIFRIKSRSVLKALLIIVPDIETAKKYLVWNEEIDELAEKYWPGQLTIVGKYREPQDGGVSLARGVVGFDRTIAVRVTADPWLKELLLKTGKPIIATSANLSGEKEIYDSNEALKTFSEFDEQPDAVVDAGLLSQNPASTIISVLQGRRQIIRQGAVKIKNSFKFNLKIKLNLGGYGMRRGFVHLAVIFSIALLSALVIFYFWKISLINIENTTRLTNSFSLPTFIPEVRNPLVKVKGLYLTAYSAGSKSKIDEIINLIERTELNAVVIDIKDYSGYVLYDSQIALVNELQTEDNRLGNVSALIRKLHEHNIYAIARQTVFQDPILAEKKIEWAIKSKSGGTWRDRKGLAWVDPTRQEVWEYNLAIAKEAAGFGFDEINFDYVRFPSDGNMENVIYNIGNKKKYEVMEEFYRFLSRRLQSQPIWISLDMFGFVMEKSGEDDMNIGQRLADAVQNTDYVCPMMYPSHYPSGHLGLRNPADYPERVFENGMQKGAPLFTDSRAKLRPWIQAFNLGAVYDASKIRAQITVTENYTDAGWLLWNASNRYTEAGLKK